MISINASSISTAKMTDRSVVSSCLLGFSNLGTGLSGISAARPASSLSLAGLPVRESNERPTKAPEAVERHRPRPMPLRRPVPDPGSRRRTTTDVGLPWARTLE